MHTSPKNIFESVLHYIEEMDWQGACHSSSAILYMIMKMNGHSPIACIGEVGDGIIIFDHSWIELKGKVLDAAISRTLINGLSFPSVYNGLKLNGEPTPFVYGRDDGKGLEGHGYAIAQMSIGDYMSSYPERKNGLWDIATIIANAHQIPFSASKAAKRYGLDKWEVR